MINTVILIINTVFLIINTLDLSLDSVVIINNTEIDTINIKFLFLIFKLFRLILNFL